eukprot:GHVL01044791.1.p2 GENE.GHVL01044791.1~~GHVL01044791.1.p2  ORF type:complete len:380 (+),score=45.31 GHVL01044791.1:40-1179(+)
MPLHRQKVVVVLFACRCIASALDTSSQALNTPKVERIELVHHSFEGPLPYDSLVDKWSLAGATIPAKDYVVLTPSIPNRTGFIWHKDPITTTNLELIFDFRVKGPSQPSSEGFAFWYVGGDKLSVPPPDQSSWNLFGYKPEYEGIGIFFSNGISTARHVPTISAIMNDGTRVVTATQIPTPETFYYQFRNTENPVRFRLRSGPRGVVGQLQSPEEVAAAGSRGDGRWVDAFRFENTNVSNNGYIGFTSSTGAMSPGAVPDKIEILSVQSYNYDLTIAGEESEILHEQVSPEHELGDILRENSHYKDQRHQSESIRELTRVLFKHVAETGPREHAMLKSLGGLQNQLHQLTQQVGRMQELLTMSGHNATDLHIMKSEVST